MSVQEDETQQSAMSAMIAMSVMSVLNCRFPKDFVDARATIHDLLYAYILHSSSINVVDADDNAIARFLSRQEMYTRLRQRNYIYYGEKYAV